MKTTPIPMKTKNNRSNLQSITVFLPVIGPRTYLKTNTASRAAAWPRAFRTFLLCGAASALWAMPATANAQPGTYMSPPVPLSANTEVPRTPPLNPPVTSMNVSTSTDFKGLLEGDPMTGTVRVTNAHPAGTYAVTVTFFGGIVVPPQTTFTLTVTTIPPCDPIDPSNPVGLSRIGDFPAGANPRSVVVGDFDRDGVQDLAVAARDPGAPAASAQGWVAVLLGKEIGGVGTGTFGKPTFYNVSGLGSTPNCVTVGDFNGDGIQDLATANSGSTNAVSVLLGDPASNMRGHFLPAMNFGGGGGGVLPRSIAVADFDGDSNQDLVLVRESGIISIYLGNGLGGFGPATDFPIGPPLPRPDTYWVAVGYFNNDTKPDLAVTIRDPDNKVLILLNTSTLGIVSFGPQVFYPSVGGIGDGLSVAVGKFNNDGTQDLAVVSQFHNGSPRDVSVLFGDPSNLGTFGSPNHLSIFARASPQSVAVGDFDDDTHQDLVVASQLANPPGTGGRVTFFLNINGTGTFPLTQNASVGDAPSSVAVGDFNGDGRQDIAVANFGSNDVSILLKRCPCGATFSEDFDLVRIPDLPASWDAGTPPTWVTSKEVPDTEVGFNNAFVDDPAGISDKHLDTPGIPIHSASAQLSFRNNYNLEGTFDGGVLEVSTDNGVTFEDITVQCTFITGGYNATINSSFGSPIAGRMAWSGNSCCYICTVVQLPAAFNDQTIKLRFRMASDGSVAGVGWRIDKVQVSNGNGSVCCNTGPAATRFGSISTRLGVGTGDNVGIGGFIVMGSEPKQVLIRAIGPSLGQVGVPDALADPVLELHGPGAFGTITNNNWRDTQEAEIQATGIPPTNDLESAIVATLDPGAYSAVIRGNNNTSGVGLIEVYDLDPAARSTLANISTRALIGTGPNVAIAGFLIYNGEIDRLILRGIGPSLTGAGVLGALADPTLELRDANGALLIANNDWQDDPAQAAEISAAGLAPTNNLESGIAATVPPGLYTALLAGLNNGTGVGSIEGYDLDAGNSTTMTSSATCGSGAVSPP